MSLVSGIMMLVGISFIACMGLSSSFIMVAIRGIFRPNCLVIGYDGSEHTRVTDDRGIHSIRPVLYHQKFVLMTKTNAFAKILRYLLRMNSSAPISPSKARKINCKMKCFVVCAGSQFVHR